MTQNVKVGDGFVVLDSEKQYSGAENPDNNEKFVRRAIGLPVKKQLVYYKNKNDADSVVNILQYQLTEMYDITDKWYSVRITNEDGSSVLIHSAYLIEMQKPSFIADMAAQME